MARDTTTTPEAGTRERWAFEYIRAETLEAKLKPPALPEAWESQGQARDVRAPGRPPQLVVRWDKVKTPSTGALVSAEKRAQLLHTFFHHELQAAELMCWAVLRFCGAPSELRAGLLRIALDEIRHMRMYAAHLETLGYAVGSFPVRDWFWQRVPAAEHIEEFLALMGVGFEGGNLDHTQRFAERFLAAGDERGARLQEIVGEEEIAHVAFARHWLNELLGPLTFASWLALLPKPLSPMVMRGFPLNRQARRRAGLDDAFLNELGAWQPTSASG